MININKPSQLPSQKFKQKLAPKGFTMKNKIIPLGFVLKFDPPILGLLYKRNELEKKKKVYQIHLKNLIFHDDEVEITKQLFYEHPQFLDPDLIEPEQVLQLVQKLLEYRELKMQEMAEFLEECENQDASNSNAFIFNKNEQETDNELAESNYLDEISNYNEDLDLDDEATYQQIKREQMQQMQMSKKQTKKLGKLGKF